MSFLDDAQAFMKQKRTQESVIGDDFLVTEKSKEQFAQELRKLYENATWPEIYRAIDWVMENNGKPYDKKIILEKIRIKLED
ncbi:MAG: hypothetical protein J6Y85_05215 [Alphaproteobacteria bacterium]|nr:hypothetical protein [Alphaproteobacteria bacterium]